MHTAAASDGDMKGVVLYIAIICRRCCCASNGFDANKQDNSYIQSIRFLVVHILYI